MQTNTLPNNLLFIDIETVPVQLWAEGESEIELLFWKKFKNQIKVYYNLADGEPSHEQCGEWWKNNAALYAEFGKVVCVCVGRIDKEHNLLIKTLCGRFEIPLLTELTGIIDKAGGLVAHNGMEFDYPFLMRRMIINGIKVPDLLDTIGKKPWDVKLDDTVKMWSGTQWQYRASLELLCHILGIQSPKQDMNGADVAPLYYSMFDGIETDELPFDKEKEVIQKIGKYCGLDIVALANVYLRLKGLPLVNNVIYV